MGVPPWRDGSIQTGAPGVRMRKPLRSAGPLISLLVTGDARPAPVEAQDLDDPMPHGVSAPTPRTCRRCHLADAFIARGKEGGAGVRRLILEDRETTAFDDDGNGCAARRRLFQHVLTGPSWESG